MPTFHHIFTPLWWHNILIKLKFWTEHYNFVVACPFSFLPSSFLPSRVSFPVPFHLPFSFFLSFLLFSSPFSPARFLRFTSLFLPPLSFLSLPWPPFRAPSPCIPYPPITRPFHLSYPFSPLLPLGVVRMACCHCQFCCGSAMFMCCSFIIVLVFYLGHCTMWVATFYTSKILWKFFWNCWKVSANYKYLQAYFISNFDIVVP